MNTRAHQSGVTMWGMIMISVMIILFGILLLQLIPPYLADLKVASALKGMKEQGGGMNNREILASLEKRFDIDEVRHVTVREDVTIQRRGRVRVISIEYEAQVPIMYNLSALMEFNHEVEVPALE